jgi:hypothetical protein
LPIHNTAFDTRYTWGLNNNPAAIYVGINAKISLYAKKYAIISVAEIGDSKWKNLKYVFF